jgi:hypothetical protein
MVTDPELTGLVWMDAAGASVVRWRGEPELTHLDSGVPPERPPAGSVRRGPARPQGGGRVGGGGTQPRHLELMRRYLTELADQLVDLERVEIVGRGEAHRQLAELLRRLASRMGDPLEITTRAESSPPTDNQLVARFRELVGKEMPRRPVGTYPGTAPIPEEEQRPMTRTQRRHRPEQREIAFEIEMLLSGEQPRW